MRCSLLAVLAACGGPTPMPPAPITIVDDIALPIRTQEAAPDDLTLPPDMNEDWLAADLATHRHVTMLLALPQPGDSPRQMGFDVVRTQTSFRGGHGTCFVTQLAHRGMFARSDVACVYLTANWQRIAPYLGRAAAGLVATQRDDKTTLVTRSVRYLEDARMLARLEQELGPITPVTGMPAELDAYNLLVGDVPIEYGRNCGFDGDPLPGQLAQQLLVARGRDDLLRNALHGLNPEGRAFAAEGLSNMGVLTAEDRAAIKKLAAQPVELARCIGCSTDQATSADVFRHF